MEGEQPEYPLKMGEWEQPFTCMAFEAVSLTGRPLHTTQRSVPRARIDECRGVLPDFKEEEKNKR